MGYPLATLIGGQERIQKVEKVAWRGIFEQMRYFSYVRSLQDERFSE